MKKIQIFCDICGKEFQPQEYAFFTGQIIKVDENLKTHLIPFEGHYCGEDTQLILADISKLKDAKYNNTPEISEEFIKERSDNGIKQ